MAQAVIRKIERFQQLPEAETSPAVHCIETAALIATFLLAVSPRMHAFWREQDPQRRAAEKVNFTKNMALVGGTLLAAAQPAR